MKILFYSTYHFNTETFGPYLECIQNHLDNGDDVDFLSCDGELSSCQVNPEHNFIKCLACKNFRNNGLECLNGLIKRHTISSVLPKEDVKNTLNKIDYSSIANFKDVYIDNFDIGISVLSSIVSIYRDADLDLLKYKDLIERQWQSSYWVYEAIKKIIDTNKYDLVYVFNARFATLRACLRACECTSTKCFVLEEGRNRQSYSIFPEVMPHSIAYYEKMIRNYWSEAKDDKEHLAMQYLTSRSESKNERVGFFTENQSKGLLPNSWNDNKINIAIFTSSEDEFVAIGKEWDNPIYKNQVEAINKIISDFKTDSEYQFYIRIHPNLKGLINDSVTNLLEIEQSNVEVISPASKISTYTLLKSADKIVSFGSSVGIESPAFNKVSILAGKSLYMNLGSTYNPTSHGELIALIRDKNLPPKDKTGSLMYAYMLLNFGKDYHHFKRINTFEATMNEKSFKLNPVLHKIRLIGRWIRIQKESFIKNRNSKIIESYKNKH